MRRHTLSGSIASDESRPPGVVREFCVSPEHRRCCWYVLVGAMVSIAVAAWVTSMDMAAANTGWLAFGFGSAATLLAVLTLLFAAYRWKLRADETGVARRRFWKWDVWPWDDFISGRVEKRRYGFVSRARPLWNRFLVLDWLDEREREFVFGLIDRILPSGEQPREALPESVKLQYHLFAFATLRAEGVSLTERSLRSSWQDLKQVRLWVLRHGSPDVQKVELEFPKRTAAIESANRLILPTRKQWLGSGPIPFVAVQFLRAHVPAEKIVCYAQRGPAATAAEYEYRIADGRKRIRRFKWFAGLILAPLTLAAIAVCLVPRIVELWQNPFAMPNLGWRLLATALIGLTMLGLPVLAWVQIVFIIRQIRRSLAELESSQTLAAKLESASP